MKLWNIFKFQNNILAWRSPRDRTIFFSENNISWRRAVCCSLRSQRLCRWACQMPSLYTTLVQHHINSKHDFRISGSQDPQAADCLVMPAGPSQGKHKAGHPVLEEPPKPASSRPCHAGHCWALAPTSRGLSLLLALRGPESTPLESQVLSIVAPFLTLPFLPLSYDNKFEVGRYLRRKKIQKKSARISFAHLTPWG